MTSYILRRLLLIIPTLFGIILINFFLIQFVPGGPIEQILAELQGKNNVFESIAGGSENNDLNNDCQSNQSNSFSEKYIGARGLPDDFIIELEKQFGFDKPPIERFFKMIWSYICFDFGESYFRSISVFDLVIEKLPVSISLGLWTTLLAYFISIPLGIKKAVNDGSRFDTWTSGAIIVGYAIPGFLFAILLLVLFSGGSYLQIFPIRGLTSDNWDTLSVSGKVLDYFWHITLPVVASSIAGFATLTLLTKNSFLDEINKQYVLTAKAKGLSEKKVLIEMLSNPGKTFSREEIAKISGITQERSIDVMITRLRQKIENNPKNPKYLQTIRGSGYVLWIE